MLKLDWAEPGDPPLNDFAPRGAHPRCNHLRAPKPQGKPVKYRSLTAERERQLIRDYWEHGDLDALDWLVGAHRPMVVAMARPMWRGNRISLKALVEYGMFGLRIAAEPPRPSKTKKGEMVGFDLNANYRFSTYARHFARKWLLAAIADNPHAVDDARSEPERDPELKARGDLIKEAWHTAPSLRGIMPDTPLRVRQLQQRSSYRKPSPNWGAVTDPPKYHKKGEKPPTPRSPFMWHPPAWAEDQFRREVRPRNFIKHPRTDLEIASMETFRSRQWLIRGTYANQEKTGVADDGMGGWGDNEDADSYFLVASFFRNHAFDGEEFRLPEEVLLERWRLGCARLGNKIPFKPNSGLGLFDKFGSMLPDLSWYYGTVTIKRKRQPCPLQCLRPLASIYFMRGEDSYEVISWRRYRGPEEELVDGLHFRERTERLMAQELYTDKIILNVPHELVEALKSRRKLTTRSAYIRQQCSRSLRRMASALP